MKEAITWADIEHRWRLLRHMEDWRVPDQNSIDAFKVSLKYPDLVRSPLLQQFEVGYLIAPDGEDRSTIIDAIAKALGRGDNGPTDPGAFGGDAISEIARRLKQRDVSPGLMHYWGWLNFASGLSAALSIIADGSISDGRDPAETRFLRQRKKKVLAADQTLQRYWCAHWMIERGYPKGGADRQEEEDELAGLCSEIKLGRRRAVLHSAAWFAAMISSSPDGPVLKTTYSRLTVPEFSRMVANELIPLSALPPLSRHGFPTIPSTYP